jgi:hypothetical protein
MPARRAPAWPRSSPEAIPLPAIGRRPGGSAEVAAAFVAEVDRCARRPRPPRGRAGRVCLFAAPRHSCPGRRIGASRVPIAGESPAAPCGAALSRHDKPGCEAASEIGRLVASAWPPRLQNRPINTSHGIECQWCVRYDTIRSGLYRERHEFPRPGHRGDLTPVPSGLVAGSIGSCVEHSYPCRPRRESRPRRTTIHRTLDW